MRRRSVETKRLTLRPLRQTDYPVWYNAYVHQRPKQNQWDRGPFSPKLCTRKWFQKIKLQHSQLAAKDHTYWYGIFENNSGHLIGDLSFYIFERGPNQFANFAYRIFNWYWGKGFGREAARAGLLIGFQQLKLNRLEASIDPENRKSIRLAQKIGMRREGLRKRWWFQQGNWADQIIFAANPEDLGLTASKPTR